MNRYRVEHPDHLVVPSLKKLELFGRWIMSDEVLVEILLGRAFRNVQELGDCLMEGYSSEALARVTQSMPWLTFIHSVNPVDLASLSDEYKLQPPLGVEAQDYAYERFQDSCPLPVLG